MKVPGRFAGTSKVKDDIVARSRKRNESSGADDLTQFQREVEELEEFGKVIEKASSKG